LFIKYACTAWTKVGVLGAKAQNRARAFHWALTGPDLVDCAYILMGKYFLHPNISEPAPIS